MITDNYIKMCEKNEDLQKMWLPIVPDFCIHNHKIPWLLRFKKDIDKIDKNIDKWIPTLEQPFEIMQRKIQPFYFGINWKGEYSIDTSVQENIFFWNHYNSLQECILEFIMRRYFNKIWDSEKWIKSDK